MQSHPCINRETMASDPFVTAFGDDDDDDDNDIAVENVDATRLDAAVAARVDEVGRTQPQRNTENGVLSFHNGTEHSLLLFVQQAVKQHMSSIQDGQHDNMRQVVLKAIDEFCFDRHWMMHVGPDKGYIVQDFLTNQIIQRQDQHQQDRTYNVVEMGTYCGYSTIRLADTLLQHNHIVPQFHIHTIDVNPQSQNIAKQLIKLAGLEQHVSFILRESTQIDHPPSVLFTRQLTDSILKQIPEGQSIATCDNDNRIDFLFVDHAKEMYLADLQLLELGGFIRQGTAVAADNVVFFQLSDYCTYMSKLQTSGIVRTELVTNNVYLEYAPASENHELRDGLEFTVYLKTPFT